jgi:hypothetical protein
LCIRHMPLAANPLRQRRDLDADIGLIGW